MSMSLSLTRLMLWPNSVTSSSAVSWSMVWVSVTGMPILNSALTRSAPRSAMRLASSWTVIASGTTTSRTCLADGPACWWARFSFSRARRSAARMRARLSSSPDKARVTVSLPRLAVVVAAAARARRLGTLGRGRRGRDGGNRGPLRRRGRARGGGRLGLLGRPARFFLGVALGLLRRLLPRRCDSLRRGGARPRSPSSWRGPRGGALPRATVMRASSASRSSRSCISRARGDVVGRARAWRGGAARRGAGAGLGASATGSGLGASARRRFARACRGCAAS